MTQQTPGTQQSQQQTPQMSPVEELAAKHRRLVGVLDDVGADGLVLSSEGALSWLLVGARVHISLAGAPILRALVTREGVEIGVFSNEAARIREEELAHLAGALDDGTVTLHPIAWHADVDAVASWFPAAAGWRLADEASAAVPLRAARASLLAPEVERYRALCRESAEVLTDALSTTTPQTSEFQLAAELGGALTARGAEPVVLLAQGADRAAHRHPLPTSGPLGRRAMAVVCARRGGLIANVTRWVGFGEPLAGEDALDAAILDVEADIFAALRPGVALADVLETIRRAYPAHGFDAEEWSRHHQGGAAGYQGRDPRVSPGVPDVLHPDQAFAFNPTGFDARQGLGAKVEDTVLMRQDGDVEVLSLDPRWPSIEVAGRDRPRTLRR